MSRPTHPAKTWRRSDKPPNQGPAADAALVAVSSEYERSRFGALLLRAGVRGVKVAKTFMISFIIPAYNEQDLIGRTVSAVHEAARTLGKAYEIIVVDDASTDGTAQIAATQGARVVTVHRRQIAATRNAGARVATG